MIEVVSTGSYSLFSKKPSDRTTGERRTRERTRRKRRRRRKRRTPLAAKSGHIYISICTHAVTPYMIKGSSKDDHAMYDKEIIER
jgi:hypothetical protein